MVAGMSAECLTYKTVAHFSGSLLRELSVGLREFWLILNREPLRHGRQAPIKSDYDYRRESLPPKMSESAGNTLCITEHFGR